MKKIVGISILSLSLLFLACGSAGTTAKNDRSSELEDMMSSMEFNINSDHAQSPSTPGVLLPAGSNASRISLVAISNYLRFEGPDKVVADLPYFGERRLNAPVNPRDLGIRFEGQPRNLRVEKVDKTGAYKINFDIRGNSETYQVNLEIKKSLRTLMSVNSMERRTIWYFGHAEQLELENKVVSR